MISAKNQNPLSRSGLKNESRKSRDIQSPSQRQCEFKLMAIERSTSVRIAEPLRNEDSSTAKLFSLIPVSVNENKCVTVAWIQP